MTARATGGSETIVNTTTDGFQSDSMIAMLADGGWVVTWTEIKEGASEVDISMQRYGADGTAIGGQTRVNTIDAASQDSAVTGLSDGGWVVTWMSYLQDGSDDIFLLQQRFDAEGEPVGSETRIGASSGTHLYSPEVAALADGGWVVTWHDWNSENGSSSVYQQRFAADGSSSGDADLVPTDTESNQSYAEVETLSDGGWVVVWLSYGQDGDAFGVFQQRYAADGSTVGPEQQVNTVVDGNQFLRSVTALSDGGWLVTWDSPDGDGNIDVYQQRFRANGIAEGGERRVNTTTAATQSAAVSTGLADGGWVVIWTSLRQDGDEWGLFQQRYDADGNAIGGETQVTIQTLGSQQDPQVSALANGGWVVTWGTIKNYDFDVYQRVFATDIDGTALADTLEGTAFDETIRAYGGNDTLDGAGGNDIMLGGFGNDTYIVDSAGDQVQEMAAQGTD
ncbi:hypothetical protein J5J09_06780, partial [Ciceribacter sp. L1K22]|nr:hypothetical protein [Ciceribacter sp. L1K22]